MSQFDFATIDPNAKSGTQLAVDLNNWRDALHSGHRGTDRPAYAQAGMLWVRETSAEQWDLMFYDGDTDFVLRSVNPTNNQLIKIPQSELDLNFGTAASLNYGTGADDLPKRSQADTLYQAKDPTLTALAGLATGADRLPYFTGSDAASQTPFTAFARTLVAADNEGEARTALDAASTASVSEKLSSTDKRVCTAWVNFIGTGTVTIRDSYNVQSVTDLGAGSFRINLSTPMNNTNYSVVYLASAFTAGVQDNGTNVAGLALGNFAVTNIVGGNGIDRDYNSIQVFGGL